MKYLGQFTLLVIFIVSSTLVSLLGNYILIDIAKLYDLKFITQFSFVQVFGIIFLIRFISKKDLDKLTLKDETPFEEKMKKDFTNAFKSLAIILFGWGLAWVMYQILS